MHLLRNYLTRKNILLWFLKASARSRHLAQNGLLNMRTVQYSQNLTKGSLSFSLFLKTSSLNLTKTNEALGPLIKTGLVPKIIQKTREQTLVYISVSKSAVIQQFSVGISERMLQGESNLRKRFY